MQTLPGTLRAAAKQRPNCTPHNRMQMMPIDEVRVPNTNKGLHKRARPSRSMASDTQKAISSRHPSIQVVFRYASTGVPERDRTFEPDVLALLHPKLLKQDRGSHRGADASQLPKHRQIRSSDGGVREGTAHDGHVLRKLVT
jgi:hypothetical protein